MSKVGLIVTCYNRPEYLSQCIESLERADKLKGLEVVFVDDCSTDERVMRMIRNVNIDNCAVFQSESNKGIKHSLMLGMDYLITKGCDIFINLDSDAIVTNDFFTELVKWHLLAPNHITTGFNCNTKNRDGSVRHKIIDEYLYYNTKASVGGINMCFNLATYKKHILPALNKPIGNWDHMACLSIMKEDLPIRCLEPSLVQHIGIQSSMGHASVEAPDTAEDFKPLHLPNVTLLIVDCVNFERAEFAINKSCENIKFGAVKILSHFGGKDKRVTKIKPLTTIQEYSQFMIKELTDYFDTEYVLVIQHDGYVMNYKTWDIEFLNYDYIGATWWYKDGFNVGNGGFSLRSKKLTNACANDEIFSVCHPEDDVICRKHRKYLENKYEMVFATDSIAKKFSIEGYRQEDNTYTNQFGFHGLNILKKLTEKKTNTIIISQPQGLGDILFAMTLADDWVKEGHTVMWPVHHAYTNLGKHFPNIHFIEKHLVNVNHEIKAEQHKNGVTVIPLRWADQILKLQFKHVMRAKYDLYHKDWRRWREISIVRDTEAENRLYSDVLGIAEGEQYNLINNHFRTDTSGISIIPEINNGLRTIRLRTLDNYTLIDWMKVIENATYIHTVSTSINYLIELYPLKAKEVHLYVRKPEEKDFNFIQYILTKEYVYHL
jgi:glycosyltransferase involved in cell wall biosynthesis